MYKPESVEEIHSSLTELLGGTFESMLNSELDDHIGTVTSLEDQEYHDSRNGYSMKKLKSSYGEFPIEIPRDRNGSFVPQVIKKHQTDVSDLESRIISMYAKGMTLRDIEDHIREIYGFRISDSQISNITDRIIPEIQEWQNRPLSEIYPIVFLDAIHFSVKYEGTIMKKAVYNIIGINIDGGKEVLGIWVGANESAKFWLVVLNELKKRGVKDI